MNRNIWNYCSFPYGERNNDGFWHYHFQLFGISFTIFLGSLIPANARRVCFASSADHFISFIKEADKMVFHHTMNLVLESPRVGSFKRTGP
jgi:hypothetical protein